MKRSGQYSTDNSQKMRNAQTERQGKSGHGWTVRRIAALIGIVLLAAMYVITLFAAIFDSSSAGRMFRLCLGLTVAIPIFLWIFIWCVGVLEHRKTIASMEILNSNPVERRKMEEEFRSTREENAKEDQSNDLKNRSGGKSTDDLCR